MPAPAGEAWDVVRDLPHRQRTRSTIETVFGADTTPGREGFRPTGVAVVRSGTVYVSYDGASGGLGGPEIISIDRNGVHHLR